MRRCADERRGVAQLAQIGLGVANQLLQRLDRQRRLIGANVRRSPATESHRGRVVCAPAGVPAALPDKMNADINSVMRFPEIRARLDEPVMVGLQTTRQADNYIRSEIARWEKVIREAGIPNQ